ncbi:MAG TPA: SIS domain-containing protein [candidate division Zixibacteria bacterium]|nr:SIS domain-containing protein [candidate division Zixibacteria bacterium]
MTPPAMRTTHPFYMYDSVLSQPEEVSNVLKENNEKYVKAAADLSQKKKVFLAGIGTSSHAAMGGEYFFRLLCGNKLDAQYIHSFEFVHYPPKLDKDAAVIVVTHRGWKTFSERATKMVKESGVLSISVTGKNPQKEVSLGEHVLLTSYQELSSAHTVSYLSALTVLLQFVEATAQELNLADKTKLGLEKLPEFLKTGLNFEQQSRKLAERLADRKRFIFVSYGPNLNTALEAALKMQETTFLFAGGYEVEQFLHGPWVSLGPEAVVFFIAPGGAGKERCLQAMKAMKEVGATTILLTEEGSATGNADEVFFLLKMPELLTPLVYIEPLQFFAYYLALKLGNNVDKNRKDQSLYQRAAEAFEL